MTRKPKEPLAPEGAPVALHSADVEHALRVLARVAEDRGALAGVDGATREALQRLAGEIARPDARQRRQLRKALGRGEREARKARDGALRKGTGIQRLREAPVFRAPLPELPPPGADASSWWPRLRAGGGAPHPPAPGASHAHGREGAAGGPELSEPRKCYVCKAEYRRLHPFYDQLCRACGDENHARRTATADLRGRVALVTGARVKIGYQAAILLLRAGCRVVALTRFPRDAAARYAREPDFDGVAGAARDLRGRPPPHALRRAPLPAARRDAAAARLPAPQRVPDRAPPAGLLRPPPPRRGGAAVGGPGAPARPRARITRRSARGCAATARRRA